jgi:hypothetical protein
MPIGASSCATRFASRLQDLITQEENHNFTLQLVSSIKTTFKGDESADMFSTSITSSFHVDFNMNCTNTAASSSAPSTAISSAANTLSARSIWPA